MNFSYWEYKTWLSNVDFAIIGSGIVGLNCALQLRNNFPIAKILILEQGVLPNGASTKNAGFACFGSVSEILEDLTAHDEEEVLQLVTKRYRGLQMLRQRLGDQAIGYLQHGGYELFSKNDAVLLEKCLFKREKINTLLKPVFKEQVYRIRENPFNFKNVASQCIYNAFEGQIDTGKMMEALIRKVQASGVKILNNCVVEKLNDHPSSVEIKTNHFTCSANKVLVATNGFASQLGIT